MGKTALTEEVLRKRVAAVKTADAINAIKGVPISDFARELSAHWARGEITGQEMINALHESHKRIAKQGPEDA